MKVDRNLAEELAAVTAQTNRTLRTLVDLIPAGVLVSDAHGTITLHNRTADAIFGGTVTGTAYGPRGGYTVHRLDGSPFPPHDLPLPRAIERGEVTHDVEILIRCRDGTERVILAAGSPIRDETGRITGAVAVFQDVTERQQTVRLLRARERQQEAIATLGEEALAGVDLSRLFDHAVRLVADTLGVEYAKVLEVLPGRSDLLLRAGVGWKKGLVGHAMVEGGTGSQAGYTLQSAHPVIVEDLRTETRFRGPPLLCDHGVESGVSVIIAGRPRPFGVFGAHTRHKRKFTEDDVNFVQSIANVLATAIERARTEEDLRRTEERLRTVTSNAPVVLFALDPNGVFTLSTGKGLEVLGLKPGEAVGRSVFEMYRTEPSILEHVRRALAGESFTAIEVTTSGLAWEARWTPLRDPNGILIGVVGVATDITQRFRAEQERERLLDRERAIAQIAQALVRQRELSNVVDVVVAQSQRVLGADVVGVWLADPARRELRLLAYRGKSPIAARLLQHLSYDAPSVTARAAKVGMPQVIEEVREQEEGLPLTRQVTAEEAMQSILALPLQSGGRLVGVVTYGWRLPRRFSEEEVAFDTTIAGLFAVAIENARLYDQVRQALEAREEFMSGAAHELRTPLTIIKGRTQLALRAGVKEEQIRRALESVDQYADRMTRIVNDLLLAARVRPGLTALHREPVDLSALVRETTSQLARAARGHPLRVEPDGPLVVDADRYLIGEVIARLIENALRYSRPGGSVEVQAQHQDGEAVVSIVDHGIGIAAERQPHAFEPFYELVPPGAPGYAGIAGLGLYLSKQIVEAHGGRVQVTSTPGQGSVFSFSLPLASVAA